MKEETPIDVVEYYNAPGRAERYLKNSFGDDGCPPADIICRTFLEKFSEDMRPKDGLIVDLGCGPGTSLFYIFKALKFKEVVAIDGSERMISILNQTFNSDTIKLRTQISDLRNGNIDVVSDSADLVISCFMMSYLENLEKLFSEVGRILKSGCFFAFNIIVHKENCTDTVKLLGESPKIMQYFHNQSKILSLAKLNGLNNVHVLDCGYKKLKNAPDLYINLCFLRKR